MATPTLTSNTNTQVIVGFTSLTAGAGYGGAPSVSYNLEYKKTSDPTYTVVTGVTSPVTVNSLTAKTSYMFRITAVNVHGSTIQSTDLSVTTYDQPDTPTGVSTTTHANNLGITVSWTAPNTNGAAITLYNVHIR